MRRLHFKFDWQKATQALVYFVGKEGGRINKMKSLKLIYFADRYHLRKYGRLITNDNYLAMQHGPVPSTTKDIAEANDYLDELVYEYSREYIEPVNNLVLEAINEIDETVLSESDLEALEFAWNTFGHLNQYELRDQTHLYPEWLKYAADLDSASCLPIDILDFLQDPDGEIEKCFELDEATRLMRSEQITELAFIDSLWGQDARGTS